MATSTDRLISEKIDTVIDKIQQGFVVISWNVLHMIHEINYVYDMSPVITQYAIKDNWSNEKLRLNDIAKIICDLLIKNSMIECFICLQEVPADLLPILREMLDSHVSSTLKSKPLMHINVYMRKPQIKGQRQGTVYTDPNESLVTIHYNPSIDLTENVEQHRLCDDQISWTPCPVDAGKGALAVTTTSGISVVNVHVPFNKEAATLLLQNITWPESNRPFVIVGDMNCDSKSLMNRITKVTTAKPASSLLFPIATNKPTRVGLRPNGAREKTWIDYHVVSESLKDLAMSPAIVYDDIGDISDHFPISLQFKGL